VLLGLVDVVGEDAKLVRRLREPLEKALADRRARYSVRVEGLGRVGEVLVAITGTKGRIPLLFDRGELEPGYVTRVIRETVDKFAF
jgi:hypothetical protein